MFPLCAILRKAGTASPGKLRVWSLFVAYMLAQCLPATNGNAAKISSFVAAQSLTISFTNTILAENIPALHDWGCVHIPAPTNNIVTVTLVSSDESEVQVPGSVDIGAGNAFQQFSLNVIHDSEVDSRQHVAITAAAAGYAAATGYVDVVDVGGFVPRLEFDAISALQQFSLTGATVLPSPLNVNYSSAALLGDTGDVLVLLNHGNVFDRSPRIHVFTSVGAYSRTIALEGFDDPEGICQLNIGSNRYAIVEEGDNDDITLVTITPTTTEIDKSAADIYPVTLPFGKLFNKGMEGVTYDAPNDCFYVVQELGPMGIYRVTLNSTDTTTEVVFDAEEIFAGIAADLSDLTYDNYSGHLFILSDTAKALFECTLNGAILATLPIPAIQPEGVVFVDDERTLLTVGEPNEVFRFSRGPSTTLSMEGTNAMVPLRLSKPMSSNVTAEFSVNGVSADPGLDFNTPVQHIVEFLPGMTSTSISITILTDLVAPETDESISIVISNVVGNATLGPQFDHFHVIRGDPFELVVHSDYGDPFPPIGTNFFSFGKTLTSFVPNSPVEIPGTTQYVCQGWFGTNSVPVNGTTTNTGAFVLTTNSSITWRWSTNFWLGASAKPPVGGIVTGANRWIHPMDEVTIGAFTNTYYYFSGWTGDVGTGDTNAFQLTVTMDASRQLEACFLPLLATNETPFWWLAFFYGPTNTFDELALSDTDQDAMTAWEEYIADTDPTDPFANLSILNVLPTGTQYVVTWSGSTQRLYTLYRTTNLTFLPNTETVTNDLPGNPGPETMVVDPAPPAPSRYYWIDVTLP
jgi:hypothetical protein